MDFTDITTMDKYSNKVVPKLDLVFKTIFTDEKNMDLLKDLIRVYLGIDEEGEYSIANNELLPEHFDNKFSQIDLHIKTKTSEINVEVQLGKQNSYKQRSLLYWAKMCVSSLRKGADYDDLRPAHTLNILDFVLFEEEPQYFNKFTLYNENRSINFGELMNLAFVELPKLKNITAEDIRRDERLAWGLYFKAEREEDFDMLANSVNTPTMQKAVDVIEQMRKDELMQERARERWLTIVNEQMEKAASERIGMKKGMEKGIIKGEDNHREKVRRYYKAKGKTDDEIAEILKEMENS